MIAQQFLSDCVAIAQQFPSDCAAIAQRLRSNFSAIAIRFISDCDGNSRNVCGVMRSDSATIAKQIRSD
jgi:hypothetical protein